MNNRKSKAKKRKLNNLEGSSSDDSSDKGEDLNSDLEERNSGGENEESSSDGSLSSTESESSSGSSIKQVRRKRSSAAEILLSDSSESGDENCEKCAICLRSITSQEVGNPEVCDHLFCSVCIIEWSKNSNVCPLDRQQFSIILVRKDKNGKVAKKVPVEEPQATRVNNVDFEELDDTVCEICGSGDREDILLLCDICDRGFHTVCLTPPLENIPDENEWFCPDCYYAAPAAAELADIFDVPSTSRSLRPRIQMVRTRLLERIRVTVNRIVENYVLQHPDELDSFEDELESFEEELESFEEELESFEDELDLKSIVSGFTSDSDCEVSDGQPGPSESAEKKNSQSKTRKRKATKSGKKKSKTTRKITRKRKATTTKRKSSSTGKRKTKRRKTRVRKTRTKKVKVENADGTITEKIVKTRTYKKRRKQRRKYKVKNIGVARRGLRVKSTTTPKTVKGRLALTLGMVPPKKPGQLLPDIKVRPPNSHISSIDLNRARAGIPKLHIFGPRDELQYYSSDSDREEFIGSDSGGVATVVPQRSNVFRIRDRKKAALALQSMPPSTVSKPKPVVVPPAREYVDILGSILDSQAVWHSKNTNVKINEDGSIEVIKDQNQDNQNTNDITVTGTKKQPENNKNIDVRAGKPEGSTTQAPMYPGAGSRPGGLRPRNTYGDVRSGGQDNAFSSRGGQSSNFNRFGAPRNDREGYTNYLNNIPQGPTPFCRGGPPLRFRMPPRQQLRRITIPVRNRPAWQREEEEDEDENDKDKGTASEEKEKKDGNEETQPKKPDEEEDIDLYSDIETTADKAENSGTEESGQSYPALGPPPEPPAFLLGLEENGEFGCENKDKSEVYDPAEPCDSEDEMVIDENKEVSPPPEKKESQQKSEAQPESKETGVRKLNFQKPSSEDEDDDEDCPIFSIYSSATREFSQKEEEERQREIAEERRKIEELKLREEKISDSAGEKNETAEIEPSQEIAKSHQDNGKKEEKQDAVPIDPEPKRDEKESGDGSSDLALAKSERERSRSRSKSVADDKVVGKERSPSSESERDKKSRSSTNALGRSSSPDRKSKRPKRKSKTYDSDSEGDTERPDGRSDEDKENDETAKLQSRRKKEDEKSDKGEESESENVSQKVATGLEGLDVEEVSSDNGDEAEFGDKRSLSSLSLSDLSNTSKRSRSPIHIKRKKKNKRKKIGKPKPGKNYEEGEIDDSEKDNRMDDSFEGAKTTNEEIENAPKEGDKKRRRSASTGSERQILGSKENKKMTKEKSKDKDLSWKKPSKKDKNYREGKKRSKERGRSKSGDRRKSKSPSPKKDQKKKKDRKKKAEKKKEIERYDVRKIVKNKEIRKTDAFGRDIISKSRSISRSRSRTPIRERSRNMLRRDSRSYSRSRSRSFRRGRSPVRRRYLRSRTRSRSKSIRSIRRSYSRSRSRSRSRKNKKKLKSKDRLKGRSRSRGRKSRSVSRGRRRSLTRSRSRSPIPRVRNKKSRRSRRSWSHNISRSPSFSPRRSRSITRSPIRLRRSYSRSVSTRSWSRGRSPLPRTSSLEKLTVVLTTKDKKKKKKEGKKSRKEEKKRKKSGNSKEVFASGDNVLVSVNFRNNNSTGNNVISSDGRNTRLNSLSPVPESETPRKKKKGSDYENERVTKKSKKSNPISKKVVDVALSSACPKRAKKLTRLSEKDAEVILNRKPVAVIDLDMSPYREQTPSPVNVVVVSDSGSGDEGKEHTPQRPTVRPTPGMEVEVIQENVVSQSVNVSAPSSPVENGYLPTSGPKTPPEPQIKFSINKPQQLRQIANPLGDDDDDDEVEEEEGEQQRMESLDRRIEKELNQRNEVSHKGPNTPPAPRGPSTPKTPPSPQTSPDAYDPFEPTKSRSPSPSQADKENRPSPKSDGKEDQPAGGVQGDVLNAVSNTVSENAEKVSDVISENKDDKVEALEKSEAIPQLDCSSSVIPNQATNPPVSDTPVSESPDKKIGVIITTPSKTQPQATQKPFVPVLKQVPLVSTASAAPPTSSGLTASSDMFSMPSPTKTSRSGPTTTTQSQQVTGIQRLQHRLGSPVNRTPNSVKLTPEKRSTPRTESNEIMSSGNYMIRNPTKRNGEQAKQPRPLQDATNETIDMTLDLDDSPYSPASSEGDDLFDPPVEPPKPSNSKPAPSYKIVAKPTHKSPVKQLSKFDLLFGPCGPTLSPAKPGNKKPNAKGPAKPSVLPKVLPQKPPKKGTPANKKNVMHKMDEDQLRILDELPSSAVELQVKDKFLKKLNRQERVVDEVKTVLKPHYARKHITKEEYKDILRRSVPKICHSRSGEINPSKIQSLIEAYVRKFRHAKKKGINAVSKPKAKKTMFS